MLTECQIWILPMELSIWKQCRIDQTWNQFPCIISISQLHSAEVRRTDTELRVLVALLQIQNHILSQLGVIRGSKREGSNMKADVILYCTVEKPTFFVLFAKL